MAESSVKDLICHVGAQQIFIERKNKDSAFLFTFFNVLLKNHTWLWFKIMCKRLAYV